MDLRLNRPQSRCLRLLQDGQTVCLPWGRGVGKSWWMRHAVYLQIARRPTRVAFVTPLLKQFRSIHVSSLETELEQWSFLGGRLSKSSWRVDFPDGSWIQAVPALEHTASGSRGLRVDMVVVDEADDVPSSVYDAVIMPWLSEPWSPKIRLIGGTPRRGRGGLLYRMHAAGLDDTVPDHHSILATWRDSPETVDPSIVDVARRMTPAAIFRREWECSFDSAEGLVYAVFSSSDIAEPPADIRWSDVLVGIDHGWEDPGCILTIGVQGKGEDAVAWVLDEVYEQHRSDSWWVARASDIAKRYKTARFFADPSRPGLVADMKAAGCRTLKTDNSIDDGVARVSDMMHQHRLRISPRCRNTLREIGLYHRRRDPHDTERYLDTIADDHNHAMDALRYTIFNYFGPRREIVVSSNRNLPGLRL